MSKDRGNSSLNRSQDALDRYLQEISKEPLLSPQQEIDLTKRVRQGESKALEKLTKANLRFVVSVAKQYQNQGLSLEDLINEGNVGLLKAATRFDETRGFKFISYAVWWIRQSILQSLAEQARIVRIPVNRIGTLNKIEKIFNALQQEFKREPSAEEIAKELHISAALVRNAMSDSGKYLSLDAPFTDEEENKLIDVLENKNDPLPDSGLLDESLKIEIERCLATLTTREAEVLKLYFGIGRDKPLTLEEIGEYFSLTRERIRQIKEKALIRLRHESRSKLLRTFLG